MVHSHLLSPEQVICHCCPPSPQEMTQVAVAENLLIVFGVAALPAEGEKVPEKEEVQLLLLYRVGQKSLPI